MKLKVLLPVTALIASSFIIICDAAYATIVNYSGSSVNMGDVAIGQTGTISNIWSVNFTIPGFVVGSGTVIGNLPTLSKITFTYSVNNVVSGGVQGFGHYDYTNNGFYGIGHYNGSSLADSQLGGLDVGHFNGTAALPLVWATANFDVAGLGHASTGTTSVQNNSQNGTYASFESAFYGVLKSLPRGATIHYAVSAIPLPASLPLFASLIAGMFLFARKRKQSALAA